MTGLLERERDFGFWGDPMETAMWRPLSWLGRETKANKRGVDGERERGWVSEL